jgi:hypothetical protein
MKHHFEVENDRIYLVITIQVWGGDVVNRYDVTESVTEAVDKALFNSN